MRPHNGKRFWVVLAFLGAVLAGVFWHFNEENKTRAGETRENAVAIGGINAKLDLILREVRKDDRR
jgi:hypothetical protein